MVKGKFRLTLLVCVGALLSFLPQVFALPDLGIVPSTQPTSSLVSTIKSADANSDQLINSVSLSNFSPDDHTHHSSTHHHCKDCPSGVCCANLTEPTGIARPNLIVEKYLEYSSFWFYEFVSSQLRPPSQKA